MADPVATVTEAPRAIVRFTQNHLIAALLLVVLLMVIFVRLESKKPGTVVMKVQKIPGVGPWATGVPNQPKSPAAPS